MRIYIYTYKSFIDFARVEPPFPSIAIDSATTFDSQVSDSLKHHPMPSVAFVIRMMWRRFYHPRNLFIITIPTVKYLVNY